MKPPIFVRDLTQEERQRLQSGLRSFDAFVLRRCQIVLASARGEHAPKIAVALGCSRQTVLDALHDFNQRGLDALVAGSSRPHTIQAAFDAAQAEKLRHLLHQSPRTFGKETSLWTLELAADVSFEQGLTQQRVTGATIRATLARLGVQWLRAEQWITSPDPAYARKKGPGTA